MAEADLSLLYREIYHTVARFVFSTADPGDAGAPALGGSDVEHTIKRIMKRGLMQFYAPPPLEGEQMSHVWSFLRPTTTITVGQRPSGNHTTAPGGGTTLTDTSATFTTGFPDDTLVGKIITSTDASTGTTYSNTVASVTDATHLEATANFNAALSSTDDTYYITVDGYNMPDAFGGIDGPLHFETPTVYPPLQITSPRRIESFLQDSTQITTYRPTYAAFRPYQTATISSTAESTRYELMLWPQPDADYVLKYRYYALITTAALQDADTDTELGFYPPGLAIHSETIVASCLAIAEHYVDPQRRSFREQEHWKERLAASVKMDRQLHGPDNLGYDRDMSDSQHGLTPYDRMQSVSYNSVTYP
jgi:hypothetical protein